MNTNDHNKNSDFVLLKFTYFILWTSQQGFEKKL